MKSGLPFVLVLTCLSAALAGCLASPTAAATATPDAAPQVRTFMGKFNQCFAQMTPDCMAAAFAPDGEVYSTGLLQASGPQAIRSYWNASFSAARLDSLAATVDSIVISGGVAVVLGTYDEKTTDTAGNANEIKLHYVAEWIRQADGSWLLHRISTVPVGSD